jgi:hypothetical protein
MAGMTEQDTVLFPPSGIWVMRIMGIGSQRDDVVEFGHLRAFPTGPPHFGWD